MSPRPLATRTPYVHRVSWSYKTIVYEVKKNKYIFIYVCIHIYFNIYSIYIYIYIHISMYINVIYIYIYIYTHIEIYSRIELLKKNGGGGERGGRRTFDVIIVLV